MTEVFLCHKCSGVLGNIDSKALGFYAYRCGCISGYIRDWQEPTPLNEIRNKQIMSTKQSLELYKRQGRDDNDRMVISQKDRLKRLLMTDASI